MRLEREALKRLIEAAEGKGWRQEGRTDTSLVWRDDLQRLLLDYVDMKQLLHDAVPEAGVSAPITLL